MFADVSQWIKVITQQWLKRRPPRTGFSFSAAEAKKKKKDKIKTNGIELDCFACADPVGWSYVPWGFVIFCAWLSPAYQLPYQCLVWPVVRGMLPLVSLGSIRTNMSNWNHHLLYICWLRNAKCWNSYLLNHQIGYSNKHVTHFGQRTFNFLKFSISIHQISQCISGTIGFF